MFVTNSVKLGLPNKATEPKARPNLRVDFRNDAVNMPMGRKPAPNAEQLLARNRSYVFASNDRIGNSMADAQLRLFATTKDGPKSVDRYYQPTRLDPTTKQYMKAESLLRPGFEVVEIKRHPALDLWHNVNPWMNNHELVYLANTYMSLSGSAYWYILRDGLGTPVEIWPLKTQWIRVVTTPKDLIGGYWYGPSPENSVFFTTEEVIWFPNQLSTSDFRVGKPTLTAAIEASDLYLKMSDYETNILDNMGIPDSVLLSEQPLPNEDERKRILQEWRHAYGGHGNAGKTALLEGAIDFKPLGAFTPREMEFLKGRDVTREEIAGVFGVPMSLLTIAGVSRATADTNFFIFQEVTIKPRLRRIQQTLNQNLIPMFDTSERLFFMFDDPVPQDKEFELRRTQTFLQVGLTARNEERALRGLDPKKGADELFIPTNVDSIENILAGNAGGSATGADTDPDPGANRDGSGRVPDE